MVPRCQISICNRVEYTLPEFLQDDAKAQYRPRYVLANKRMKLSDAEAHLEKTFPGIRLDYLKLLIAAVGCAEGGTGQDPKIAVDGPSGAGKSLTVQIAAALLGTRHVDVPWSKNDDLVFQKLYEASNNAGLVTANEIIKFASQSDVRSALNPLLSFAKGSMARKLYVGPVTVQRVPPIIITDIAYPNELINDEQLGRRFVYVHLERKVDWQNSISCGIERWRCQSKENANAANAIISQVIDDFFSGQQPLTFEAIAKQLGFELLNQGGDLGLDPKADLLALFQACCDTSASAASESTWKGKGWKQIHRHQEDNLSRAWKTVCDDLNDGFCQSRRVKEVDWSQILGCGTVLAGAGSGSNQLGE